MTKQDRKLTVSLAAGDFTETEDRIWNLVRAMHTAPGVVTVDPDEYDDWIRYKNESARFPLESRYGGIMMLNLGCYSVAIVPRPRPQPKVLKAYQCKVSKEVRYYTEDRNDLRMDRVPDYDQEIPVKKEQV